MSGVLKFQYKRHSHESIHQVIRYNDFINNSLDLNTKSGPLKIFLSKKTIAIKIQREIAAINPGASYGSAKRWCPEKIAKVVSFLADRFDIVIFGGKRDLKISTVSLFIAGDSAPCISLLPFRYLRCYFWPDYKNANIALGKIKIAPYYQWLCALSAMYEEGMP